MKKTLGLTLTIMALSLLPSCGGGNVSHSGEGNQIDMHHARNLSMTELGDDVTLVTLRNPWDTTRNMARYALVPRGHEAPATLPEGTVTLTVPLERSVVYSGVHVSLIDELGAMDAVNGVCDAAYINDERAKAALASGRIADCGSNQSPNMERIVSLHPQAILLSPYEKSDEASRFARTGISVVETADYMEPTPLGRAEWMRFYGRLYGKGAKADSLFGAIEKRYAEVRDRAAKAKTQPYVLFDRLYSGVWDVPTSGSVTGRLINDAGGLNPFAMRRESGSAHLTAEEVLYKAKDADIWLIRHFEPSGLSLSALKADNPIYAKFKAYKNGNVYGANTLKRPLFEDGAFHPQLVLEEMVRLLHPELTAPGDTLRYYRKL